MGSTSLRPPQRVAAGGSGPLLPEALSLFKSRLRIPKKYLFHYTSRAAVGNIIGTKRMWATDLRFMNDPDEVIYSTRIIEKVLDTVALRQQDVQRALWLTLMKKSLRNLLQDTRFYSLSLSAEPDSASQWRAYGDDGQGFALGWSVDSNHREVPLRMGIVYDEPEQVDLLGEMVDLHLAHFAGEKDLTKGEGLKAMSRAAGSLGVILDIWVSSFKQEKWAAEQELRYVYQALGDIVPKGTIVKVRGGGSTAKQYIEVDFSEAELGYVIVGPRVDEAGIQWLTTLLKSNGYGLTRVVRSTAGWGP